MIVHVIGNAYCVVVSDDAISMFGQPLPESQWNGRGRWYSIRYWPCHLLDKDDGHSTVKTKDEDVVSMTIVGLEEWTAYCVQLTACNEKGCSESGDTTASVRTLESGIHSRFSNCFSLSQIASIFLKCFYLSQTAFIFLRLLLSFSDCFYPLRTLLLIDYCVLY